VWAQQQVPAGSPWSGGNYERTPAFPSFGAATTTGFGINPELEQVKASRARARLLAFVLLVGVGGGGYWGYKERLRLTGNVSQQSWLEKTNKEALATIEKQKAQIAALETKAKQAEQKGAGGEAVAPGAREASAKLAEDLKKLLAGSKDITVEARDEKVVVSVPDKALFSGIQAEIGLDGFRVLYRLGKGLKAVKDRQVLVTAQASELKKIKGGRYPSTWDLAAARGIAIARFLVDDLGMDAKRVGAATPSPHAGRKGGHGGKLEIALSPAPAEPAASRS
jgi:hypothetical protein